MQLHFISGAIINGSTTAKAGDEIDVAENLARALIAQGIAYSLEAAVSKPTDTAIAELVDPDGTLAANSDALIASQKAVKTYVGNAVGVPKDTDGTLAANSDAKVATQKATKTYADAGDATAVHKTGNESIGGNKTFSGNVLMTALPTADPHVIGELWNSAGTVTVSAG